MNKIVYSRGTVVVALLLLLSATASALIIINTDQSASGSLGTVDLNIGDTGTSIFGTTDQGALLEFKGGEDLVVPAGGQARIEADDGEFDALEIFFFNGSLFDRLVFNLDAASAGTLSVSAFDQFGNVFSQDLTLSATGQNFINVDSDDLQQIRSVQFTSTAGLTDIAQVRVGGVGLPGDPVIPEPGTIALLGLGMAAIAIKKLKFNRGVRQ